LENSPPKLKVNRTVEGAFTPEYNRMEVLIHGLQVPPQSIHIDGNLVETYLLDKSEHILTFESKLFDTIEVILEDRPR
jgi:hypothetical protein